MNILKTNKKTTILTLNIYFLESLLVWYGHFLSSNKVLVSSEISSLWFDSGSDGDTKLGENWKKLFSKGHILHHFVHLYSLSASSKKSIASA